jgi:hypothetical protein
VLERVATKFTELRKKEVRGTSRNSDKKLHNLSLPPNY